MAGAKLESGGSVSVGAGTVSEAVFNTKKLDPPRSASWGGSKGEVVVVAAAAGAVVDVDDVAAAVDGVARGVCGGCMTATELKGGLGELTEEATEAETLLSVSLWGARAQISRQRH